MSNKKYVDTLNLPRTDFPMKASLKKMEPEILRFWEENKIYERMLEKRKNRDYFILHDGPPYANGHIHLGHALNKILKDIVVKYKSLKGFWCKFVPGWDCHGLPIELKVEEEEGKKSKTAPVSFRQKCRKYAERFINIQREEFKRLGVFGDWDKPYITMDYKYESMILDEFRKVVEKGFVYRRKKPVLWCPNCETALAEAEVEYGTKTSPSIYVKFPITSSTLKKLNIDVESAYVLIWTTTPWTLPANLAIAFHPDEIYIISEWENGEVYLLAKALKDKVAEETGIKLRKTIKELKGKELEGLTAQHPFYKRKSLFLLAEYVTMDEGTGCVHTAPGHGEEDYESGVKYNLDIYSPVDEKGIFDNTVELFSGLFVFDANPKIIEHMKNNGTLLYSSTITHSYPHCWRCKNPVIFRATPQWFLSVDKNSLRQKALEAIRRVKWIPEWGEERIYSMIEVRPDWCLSRQRIWGVPITAFYCINCGKEILDPALMKNYVELFKKEGADIWFKLETNQLLPPDYSCPECGSKNLKKETDILDVWFDSGVSHAVVLEGTDGLRWPADMYLEGSDQHRGWFHSSLLMAIATREREPYRIVLTHGFVVDEEGRKMAKSLGNVINPQEIIEKYGAEILRLWVSAEDYREDVRLSFKILEGFVDAYRKIRNTIRFLLGNLYDFNPELDMISLDELTPIDKFILLKFDRLIKTVTDAYEKFEFHRVYHSIHRFCVVDLSAFYFDVLKDRLYTFKKDSMERRSSQTAFYIILRDLLIMLGPVFSFTCEEAWKYLPGEKAESVFLADFPQGVNIKVSPEFERDWNLLMEVREEVLKALESARKSKLIGSSLEGKVILHAGGVKREVLLKYQDFLPTLFIVSQVELRDGKFEVKVSRADGKKCERCWNYSPSVGTLDIPDICNKCYAVLKG